MPAVNALQDCMNSADFAFPGKVLLQICRGRNSFVPPHEMKQRRTLSDIGIQPSDTPSHKKIAAPGTFMDTRFDLLTERNIGNQESSHSPRPHFEYPTWPCHINKGDAPLPSLRKLAPAKMVCPGHEPTSKGPKLYKKSDRENIPYDINTSKSGGQDGTFRLGANFTRAKMACLVREKVTSLGRPTFPGGHKGRICWLFLIWSHQPPNSSAHPDPAGSYDGRWGQACLRGRGIKKPKPKSYNWNSKITAFPMEITISQLKNYYILSFMLKNKPSFETKTNKRGGSVCLCVCVFIRKRNIFWTFFFVKTSCRSILSLIRYNAESFLFILWGSQREKVFNKGVWCFVHEWRVWAQISSHSHYAFGPGRESMF